MDLLERGITGGIWIQDPVSYSEKDILPNLAMPRETYKSPLQRLGEALRLPQSGNALTKALAEDRVPHVRIQQSPKRPVEQPFHPDSPMRPPAGHAYILVPGGDAPITNDTTYNAALGSGQQHFARKERSNLKPTSRALPSPPHTNGYFASPHLLSSLVSNPRTRAPFKPQKSNRGTSSWQLKQYAEATLGSGSLRKAVKLPEGEDKDEWLAVNSKDTDTFTMPRLIFIAVVDFYNQINLLYGSITEFCSPQSCPEMKATDE